MYERIKGHRSRFSPKNLQHAALQGAKLVQQRTVEDMYYGKTGIKWPNLDYISSKGPITDKNADNIPEFPAAQSGELASSIKANPGPLKNFVGEAYVETNHPHAHYMEYGFRAWGTGEMHYRPFMRTAAVRWRDDAIAEMRKALE